MHVASPIKSFKTSIKSIFYTYKHDVFSEIFKHKQMLHGLIKIKNSLL